MTYAPILFPKTVILPAVKTAWTDADDPYSNHGSDLLIHNGGNNVESTRTTLLQFDTALIPNKVPVREARLRLYCSAESSNKGGTYALRGLLKDWLESGVNHLSTGFEPWTGGNINAAGNYDASPVLSVVNHAPVDGGGNPNPYYVAGSYPEGHDWAGEIIEFEITELVSGWVSRARENHGLCLTCRSKVSDPQDLIDEYYGYMDLVWHSRHNDHPPELVVTYGYDPQVDEDIPLDRTWYEIVTEDGNPVFMDEKGIPGQRYPIPDNTTIQIRGIVTARQVGGTAGQLGDSAAYVIDFAIIRRTGGVTNFGGSSIATHVEADPPWGVAFDVAAIQANNTIEMKATGSADKQVKWRAQLEIWKVD